MSLSPDQIELRKAGITATDIAAIIGVHPHRTALDVWLDKTGAPSTFIGNDRTVWGNLLEPVIRRDYEERHGVRVEVPGTLSVDWRMATPDGIAYPSGSPDPSRGLEIKVHGRQAMFALDYGAPGSDEVPEHELVQCMWCIDVSGLDRWDLITFDGVPTEYTINRDDELISMLRERGERFLVDNVRANVAPPPDGSDRYAEWLRSRWKQSAGMIDVRDQPQTLGVIDALRERKAIHADAERAIELLEQRLKAVIGDAAGITWPNRHGKPGSITWKFAASGGTSIDHEGIVQDMKIAAALILESKTAELGAIDLALRKLGGGYVGSTTFSGIALAKTIEEIRSTLTDIAKAVTTPNHIKTAAGSRRFLTPRSWTKAQE